MNVLTILCKDIKWRTHHALTIIITILQPLLWLALYSVIANQSMQQTGIENYTAFMLPGLIVLVTFSACSSGGMMNYMMKKDGSFYRILIAPVKRSSIILGQLLEAVLCSFLEVLLIIMMSLLFSVHLSADLTGWFWIFLLLFFSAFLMAAFSYSISLLLPNEMVYETMMNAIVLPLFFLSSALFPADHITGFLGTAIQLNPFTYVINTIREIMLNGHIPYESLFFTLGLLVILSLFTFMLAHHRLQKETDL